MSVIVEQSLADRHFTIRGRVLDVRTGRPLRSGQVRVATIDSGWRMVDPDGSVTFQAPISGSYAVEVRAPGYDDVSRSVTVRPDSGAAWIAAMQRIDAATVNRLCGVDTTFVPTRKGSRGRRS